MEGQLEWKERYNIGIDRIDGQHQRLFRIINKLRSVSEDEDKGPWVCQEGIKYFKNYAAKHFAEEEEYMASISYKDLAIHRRLHEDFRLRRLPALERELEDAEYTKEAIDHLRAICTGWLVEHIQVEDQAIAGNGIGRWASLASRAELEPVSRSIREKLQEIFGQEPQVLSECYNGEAFGEGVYFRFSYGSKEKGKQDIVLTFEKRLLIHMIEHQAEEQQERSGSMMLENIREVAERLEEIQDYFFEDEKYQQLGENQLTRDQFRRILLRQHPRFSLLFDTGIGYFGYCVLTPHFTQKDAEAVKEDLQTEEQEEEGPETDETSGKEETSAKKGAGGSGKDTGGARKGAGGSGKDTGAVKKIFGAFGKEAGSAKKGFGESGKKAGSAKKGLGESGKDNGSAGSGLQSPEKEHGREKTQRERKKVLVVDDSRMVRQVMQDLLQKEYRVTVAKSGISAIRCMAKERPDLILLDYNMPVCDGALLLEMIRTEEDFADIPVIFLTATIDKESVKRVVPFKPAGYLLKSLKPMEIKKKIDLYFAKTDGGKG